METENDRITPHRFTKAQEEAYIPTDNILYSKTKSSAGVRLSFETNTSFLKLTVECGYIHTRNFAGFDVYVNGNLHTHLLEPLSMDKDIYIYTITSKFGNTDTKNVTVYLPFTARTSVLSVDVDDNAFITPLKKDKKMLCFGDSITHGFNAYNPSFSYVSRLTDLLGTDTINKGIGGDRFYPPLSAAKDDITPDIITVAYGTNDWHLSTPEEFDLNSQKFLSNLSENYPTAKIFALTPIWRGDRDNPKLIRNFDYIGERIIEVAASLPNVISLNGYDFVPHDPAFFLPDMLHPNDFGFFHYAANLYAEMKKHL